MSFLIVFGLPPCYFMKVVTMAAGLVLTKQGPPNLLKSLNVFKHRYFLEVRGACGLVHFV
jgi:hypothetical protein